jgi:hypothetical protein
MPNPETLDFDIDDQSDDPVELSAVIGQIQERCKAAGIKSDTVVDEDGDTLVTISFKAGRETKDITLYELPDLKSLLAIEFEKYGFLNKYLAIRSLKDDYVEAYFRPLAQQVRFMNPSAIFSKLAKRPIDLSKINPGDNILTLEDPKDASRIIEIGPCSEILRAMQGSGRASPAIRLRGFDINTQEKAEATLAKIASSLFFQIELSYGIPLGLHYLQKGANRPSAIKNSEIKNITFPRHEYDQAPISLYWYAHAASSLPLLQYLAFYQSIEFYFPAYARSELGRQLRNILKDPLFDFNSDSDIGRLVSSLYGSTKPAFSTERDQLKSTIASCIDKDEIRSFLTESAERSEFYRKKAKGLSDICITTHPDDADLRPFVADRIYDIRCKIVHTKHDGKEGYELLLPYTEAAELVTDEIPLIRFVAQKILISGSKELK